MFFVLLKRCSVLRLRFGFRAVFASFNMFLHVIRMCVTWFLFANFIKDQQPIIGKVPIKIERHAVPSAFFLVYQIGLTLLLSLRVCFLLFFSYGIGQI